MHAKVLPGQRFLLKNLARVKVNAGPGDPGSAAVKSGNGSLRTIEPLEATAAAAIRGTSTIIALTHAYNRPTLGSPPGKCYMSAIGPGFPGAGLRLLRHGRRFWL